jgi:hypothetical protein
MISVESHTPVLLLVEVDARGSWVPTMVSLGFWNIWPKSFPMSTER